MSDDPTQVRIDVRIEVGVLVYSILLNIPINYHPMDLLPPLASTSIHQSSTNLADLCTKPLSRHRFASTTSDVLPTPTTSVVITTSAPIVTVDSLATTATSPSNSVPTLHPNLDPALILPIVLDAGASFPLTPFSLDFIPAPYGLIHSASTSVASNSKVPSITLVSNPVDTHTLITGEDTAFSVDLSSMAFDSDLVKFASALLSDSNHYKLEVFGTATLTCVYSGNTLVHIWVEPTKFDWFDWIPLPRLILPESYFHIFGLDFLQAFALFHSILIWIYYLLHFGLE